MRARVIKYGRVTKQIYQLKREQIKNKKPHARKGCICIHVTTQLKKTGGGLLGGVWHERKSWTQTVV